MNISKELKVIIWATAGCGSRTFMSSIHQTGINDLQNVLEDFIFPITGPFTHQQGVPEGSEEFPIICLTRNPYSRIVSAYLDEARDYDEKKSENDDKLSFQTWLEQFYFIEPRYPSSKADFFVEEWQNIGYVPNYFVRMEHMEEDIKKIPELSKLNFTDEIIDGLIRKNNYANENPYDQYNGNFQNYQRFYDENIANFVYSKIPNYFEIFGYSKDSWK
jgi:hypothetical protein